MTGEMVSNVNSGLQTLYSRLRTSRWKEGAILFCLALLALFPRLIRLNTVPPGLDGDELFNAIDALQVGWDNLPVYFEGNNGREAIYIYLMAFSLKLFGQTVAAVRLPAVLLGTGSVLLAYGIGRIEFGRRVGLVTGILMAISIWPIMHSRWGLRAVGLTFFTALTVYLYGRARRAKRRAILWWLASGVALGLTIYTYIPARVFPLVILGWFIWIALTQREVWRLIRSKFILSLLVALVVFAPFGLYMVRNPEKVKQRIATVSGINAWEKALDGEPAALLETVSSVLLMFNFSGDTALRYHVDARPVFDPLTGLLFLMGLIASIWLAFNRRSQNRAGYGLMLLWLGAMLAPNAILGADTSFLRGAGAIVPVYLLAAIGLDAIYGWLLKHWPNRKKAWRGGLVALIVIGSLATLADTWQTYFVSWPEGIVVREVYHAGLARIGDYLNQNPPPDGTEIFIAYDYVSDAAPRSFAYYSDQEVIWFDNQNTFGWRPLAQESYYFVPDNRSLTAAASDKLSSAAEVAELTFSNDDPAFLLYRLENSSFNWSPQHELNLHFVDGPQLIGFDLEQPLYRGEPAQIILHWQVADNQQPIPNRLSYAQVFLEDESGNIWQQAESLLGYPEAGWQAGDRFNQFITLEIPPGIPPGPVYLRFGLRDWTGHTFPLIGGSDYDTQPFTVHSRPVQNITLDPETPVFGEILALSGHTFSSLIAPGLAVDMSLEWLALADPIDNYQLIFELILPGGKEPFLSQNSGLWPDRYPTSQWQQGDRVTTLHRLQIPLDIPTETNPLLRVRVVQEDDGSVLPVTRGDNTLSEMTLSLREHLFEEPAISQPYKAQFGEQIRLLGYDLESTNVRPSGELNLTLYWQAIETPETSYTVFNHIVDQGGQIQGQLDSPPVSDAWLTSTWLPGEIIIERRTIPIRPGATGPHTLIIGLYDSKDGSRLPVRIDGRLQPADQIVLSDISIAP